uniref:SEA domain-containing protein n=1 Tax=Setaria digitata TaxID=48799 RepID=A0A915PNZ9_9BILA
MILLPSLLTATAFLATYRFTINFTNLPYSNELRQPYTKQFTQISQNISNSIHTLLVQSLHGQYNISVINYRYQQVIGTLVTLEVTSKKPEPRLRKVIKKAIQSGNIGGYTVATDGFEFYTIEGQ